MSEFPEQVWLLGGTLLLLGASVAAWLDAPRSRRWLVLLALATSCLVIAVAVRWVRLGEGPFMTLYDVLLSNAFSLSAVYLAACAGNAPLRLGAPLGLPALAIIASWALTADANPVPLPATFGSAWLWLHVLSGKLYLGLLLCSAAVMSMGLLGRLDARDDPLVRTAVWRTASLAFLGQTLMLIAGAAWARDAWGRFWAWDPLETWSLLTWLLLAALLHARHAWRLSTGVAATGIVIIFVLAVLTFLGVPFVSESVHKGVM